MDVVRHRRRGLRARAGAAQGQSTATRTGDDLYDAAVRFVLLPSAAAPRAQRKFAIGYTRAGRRST
jgi:DNA segregation ATPase FtsK/SpoIIIE-like protein